MCALLSKLEEAAVESIREDRDQLVALTSELVSYDTTSRGPGDPARDEERLQRALQRRLGAIGAETDLWEPTPIGPDHPFRIEAGLSFAGRPQLAARLPGRGGGRSLLLNGHIDAVATGPPQRWSSDPFEAELRDGRLYGRGCADMKGGIAGLLCALEALRRAGVRLSGDVVFCTNTDEETVGAGGWAAVSHGVRADAGITAEPTGFDAWTACRGAATGILRVEGRPGHAEVPQPSWRDGGAVNAVEKALPLVASLTALRDELRTRPDQQHSLLSPGGVVPTMISGGTSVATYPESCEVVCDVQYLPPRLESGADGNPLDEVMSWVNAVASQDEWLVEHPPRWDWVANCPPAEVRQDHPIVTAALSAARDVGREGKVAGLDAWHDAATFTLFGGTPTISFGPGGLESAHGFDEFVAVDDLVDFCAAIALVAIRWCGA